MFLKSTFSFFFSFLFFLLWSGSGTSRKVVSALNSRADVTSLLVIVFTCFLGSLLSSPTRFTENLSIYLSPPAPNSPLQNPSNFGATAFPLANLLFIIFLFFWFFNRMDAWSLMHGDAFIHFVCGSRRVNIRLGVLLLIPKSPHNPWPNDAALPPKSLPTPKSLLSGIAKYIHMLTISVPISGFDPRLIVVLFSFPQ